MGGTGKWGMRLDCTTTDGEKPVKKRTSRRRSSPLVVPNLPIEAGVTPLMRRTPHTTAVWNAMEKCETGESFFVGYDMMTNKALRVFLSRTQKKMNRKFACWREATGSRVWRSE